LLPGAALATITASQCGQVVNSGRDGTEAFNAAVLDCCLQLGATGSGSGRMELKVPAGLGAVLATGQLSGPSLSSVAKLRDDLARGSASVVDYSLGDSAGGGCLSVRELMSKPLIRSAAVASGAAAGKIITTQEANYEVGWPVAAPVGESEAALTVTAAPAVLRLPFASLLGGIAAASATLSSLQQAVLTAGSSAVLSTVGSLSLEESLVQGQPAWPAAGLHGLLRAVGTEHRGVAMRVSDLDALTPTSSQAQLELLPLGSGSAAQAGDAYGGAVRGRGARRAQLMPSRVRSSLPPFHLMPEPRGALGNLVPKPVALDGPLASDHVAMAVKAVGINFRQDKICKKIAHYWLI
jgi:hypothetical protein